MISKKKYIMMGMLLVVVLVGSVLFVPAPYKAIVALGSNFLIMFVALQYKKTLQKCYKQVRAYDEKKEFKKVVDYILDIDASGYRNFVIDSYLLYAYYELGDFKAYEETVLKMQRYREWKRPKFEDLRSKIRDNLACISLLKQLADTGEVQYKGNNLMMMQAIDDHQKQNSEAILHLIQEYPNVPKLKKVCLYVLAGKYEIAEGYYESDIAKDLIRTIKERKQNG